MDNLASSIASLIRSAIKGLRGRVEYEYRIVGRLVIPDKSTWCGRLSEVDAGYEATKAK